MFGLKNISVIDEDLQGVAPILDELLLENAVRRRRETASGT
jgi:hypothetical protein